MLRNDIQQFQDSASLCLDNIGIQRFFILYNLISTTLKGRMKVLEIFVVNFYLVLCIWKYILSGILHNDKSVGANKGDLK